MCCQTPRPLKIILLLFSVAFTCLIISQIYMERVIKESHESEIFKQIKPYPFLIITVAVINFILILIALFATYKECIVLLKTFAVIFVISSIFYLSYGVVVYPNFKHNSTIEFLEQSIQQYGDKDTFRNDFVDDLQREYHCCGVNSSEDYRKNNITLPESCKDSPNSDKAFEKGCGLYVTEYLQHNSDILSKLSMITAFIGIVGIIGLFQLAGVLKDLKQKENNFERIRINVES